MILAKPNSNKSNATKDKKMANSKEQPSSEIKPLKYTGKKRGRKPKPKAPPEPIVIVKDKRPSDILHGRGLPYHSNPGNMRLKAIVAKKKQAYKDAEKEKGQKKEIAMLVMDKIREGQAHPVRFLKRIGTGHNAKWRLATEKEAYTKVAHALREGDKKKKAEPIVPSGQPAIGETNNGKQLEAEPTLADSDVGEKQAPPPPSKVTLAVLQRRARGVEGDRRLNLRACAPTEEGSDVDAESLLAADLSILDSCLVMDPSLSANLSIDDVHFDDLGDVFVGGDEEEATMPDGGSMWNPQVPRGGSGGGFSSCGSEVNVAENAERFSMSDDVSLIDIDMENLLFWERVASL